MDAILRGTNLESQENANIINSIISTINRSGNIKSGAILFIGQKQFYAIARLSDSTVISLRNSVINNKDFAGFKVVRVYEDDFCRLMA